METVEKATEEQAPEESKEPEYTYTAVRVALFPSEEQKRQLNDVFTAGRALYNQLLALTKYLYMEKKVASEQELHPNDQDFFDTFMHNAGNKLAYEISQEIKPGNDYPGKFALGKIGNRFLKRSDNALFHKKWISSSLYQSQAEILDTAYQAFWRSSNPSGAPKFRGFYSHKSARYYIIKNKSQKTVRVFTRSPEDKATYIHIQKLGKIRCHYNRKLVKGTIKSVTVSLSPDGHYFASAIVKRVAQPPVILERIRKGRVVGIDLNINRDTGITLSDGKVYQMPIDKLKVLEEDVVRQQKKLSRRRNHYKKEYELMAAKMRAEKRGDEIPRLNYDDVRGCREAQHSYAKAHARVANLRKYYLDLITTEIARKFDAVVVGKMNVKSMLHDSYYAHALSRASFNRFVVLLQQKCKKYHCHFVEVSMKNVNQTCYHCGFLAEDLFKEKPLSIREWDCPQCGHHNFRDLNAARNIRVRGIDAINEEIIEKAKKAAKKKKD